MTERSKIGILSILAQIAIFVPLYLRAISRSAAENDLLASMQTWAWFLIQLLIASVIVMIVMTVAVQITMKIKDPRSTVFSITDERDRLIEFKSLRNFGFVFFRFLPRRDFSHQWLVNINGPLL